MFKIGDFSKIARVSGRQLRYYDSIRLLSPARSDPTTGYRYYTAEQLVRLNKILALRELGLSLEQIAQLLDGRISSEEIRGMFMLKKAELERRVSEEALRLRNVESRLSQIDEKGLASDCDVVVKSAPAQPYLAYRQMFPNFAGAVAALREVSQVGKRHIPQSLREALLVVAYSDFEDENLDFAIGFSLREETERSLVLPSGAELRPTTLPDAETLATVARRGPTYQSHLAFGALGMWMETNRFEIAGPSRELFLKTPFESPDSDDAVIEIQFPVRRAA
jgi:DNA-binding transcriptional MerR regulator